jgi:23S rRNA (adenine2503-C2)-methyltransferase
MKVKRFNSTDADVSKYVFDFGNAVAESVLYKYGTYNDRTVICCSTQSGCPIGCRFCGAGDAFVRSLTADEIITQVQHCFADNNIDASCVKNGQIMFMSMGEPMLNFKALSKAIEILNIMHPNFALLISTSAPRVDYNPLIELSKRIDKVGLQFSVHESTDEARNTLIPFKEKLTLAEIANIGNRWFYSTGRTPFFNYCAGENNTSIDDAERLIHLFDHRIWQATISVICERGESIAASNIRQSELASGFMSKLSSLGYSTRCFNPAGQDDIGGGCGQLWYVQKWMSDNKDLIRNSVGGGLPVVHAPKNVALMTM